MREILCVLVGGMGRSLVGWLVACIVVFAFAVRFLDRYRLTGVLGVVVWLVLRW